MNDRKESSGIARKMFRFLFLALFSVMSLAASAQSITVSGVVSDRSGDPLTGATVQVKGTKVAVATDLDGNYKLVNVAPNATLEFRYIGCRTREEKVAGRTTIDVTLEDDNELLDEVIVVGYGTAKKSDITGSVSRVNAEQLQTRPVRNAFEALQGKAAGVDITTSERPGTVGSVRIRGNRSLSAGQGPLYVVDGVPLNSGSGIETLNPQDIESIDILKDASATAIYGSQGANGVILVTTKQGKPGQFSLTYSGSVTTSKIVDKSKKMGTGDFVTFRRWAAYNANPDKYPHPNDATYESDKFLFDSGFDNQTSRDNLLKGWGADHRIWDPDLVPEYDWIGEYTRTGITQEHTLAASGGTDKMNAYASFGYLKNDGTQKGQWYERYTGKVTANITPVPWFSVQASINASWQEQDYGLSSSGYGSKTGAPDDIYQLATRFAPYSVPFDEEGNMVLTPGFDGLKNIVGELNYQSHRRQTFRALGSFAATVKFGEFWKPLQGLDYRIAFGPDFRHYREANWFDGNSSYKRNNDGTEGVNSASVANQRHFSWTLDNMITYNRTFGKHTVGATLLQSATSYNYENSSASGSHIPLNSMLWNALGAVPTLDDNGKVNIGVGSGLVEKSMESYMIRVNYAFDNRYLLTASGRWDGASQLAEGHKWDFFPSVALGWRIQQEDFLNDVEWLTNLKIRAGIGTTGNAAISPYQTTSSISALYIPFTGFTTAVPGYSTAEDFYQIAEPMANAGLGWEKTTQTNLGVDFGFFNGRLAGSVDFYWTRTNDLLLKYYLPTLTGYQYTYANVGKTKNHGIEFTIDAIPVQTRDFEWTTNFNAAYQSNEIVELANGKEDDVANGWFIGQAIGVQYALDNAGIWQDTAADRAEMEKFNANGHKFEPGKVRPVDQNGDYMIDDEDRVILGNTNPKWTLGWSNTFTYKGIELGFQMIARLDYRVNLGAEALTANDLQRKVDYWTPENTGAYYQKPILAQASAGSGDEYSSLLGYRKGGFVKLRNISIGYNFPTRLLKKATIKNLKVYAQCINPFSIYDSVEGFDLDTGRNYYNRSFAFGLQVGF